MIDLTLFTSEYIDTLLWSEFDQRNKRMSREGKKIAYTNCFAFVNQVIDRLDKDIALQLLNISGTDFNYLAAHDFWLSSKGHGTGFWDKTQYNDIYEGAGDILHEIAQKFSSDVCIYRGKVDFI